MNCSQCETCVSFDLYYCSLVYPYPVIKDDTCSQYLPNHLEGEELKQYIKEHKKIQNSKTKENSK